MKLYIIITITLSLSHLLYYHFILLLSLCKLFVSERSSFDDNAGIRGTKFGVHFVRTRRRCRQYQLVGTAFHDNVSTYQAPIIIYI